MIKLHLCCNQREHCWEVMNLNNEVIFSGELKDCENYLKVIEEESKSQRVIMKYLVYEYDSVTMERLEFNSIFEAKMYALDEKISEYKLIIIE